MKLRKHIRNLPEPVLWLIMIAFCVILLFLPISEFTAGMVTGMIITIFLIVIPGMREVDRILKNKEDE